MARSSKQLLREGEFSSRPFYQRSRDLQRHVAPRERPSTAHAMPPCDTTTADCHERTRRLGGVSYRTIDGRFETRQNSTRCAFTRFVTPAVRKVSAILGITLEMATGPSLGRVTFGLYVRWSLCHCAPWMHARCRSLRCSAGRRSLSLHGMGDPSAVRWPDNPAWDHRGLWAVVEALCDWGSHRTVSSDLTR